MFKIGERASYYLTTHKVGTIVDIQYYKTSNVLTTGGTTNARVFLLIEYKDGTQKQYPSGDVVKVYD